MNHFSKTFARARHAAKIVTLAMAVATTPASIALAETSGSAKNLNSTINTQASKSSKRISFDWFANRQSAADAQLIRASMTKVQSGHKLGRGSYICSPAGFGKRSSCFAR